MQSRPAHSVRHRFPDRVPGWRRQGSERSELFGWSAFGFVLGSQRWEPLLSNLKGTRHLKSEHDMGTLTLASKLSVEFDPNNYSNIGAAPDAISAFEGYKQSYVRETLVAKKTMSWFQHDEFPKTVVTDWFQSPNRGELCGFRT